MKVAVFINQHLSAQQLKENHLLCLALLNFEHQVHVVFFNQAWDRIFVDSTSQKQWLSLQLYGAEKFLQFNSQTINQHDNCNQHCHVIDQADFEQLVSEMDLLL